MKILYLAAGHALLEEKAIYNDLVIKRDINCDMMDVPLWGFDLIIATPPCNYWSRANCNINSEYSQKTKHLLPDIINKLSALGKPFIVENVINKRRMKEIIDNFPYRYIEHGRHCYFTNIDVDFSSVPQTQDFKYGGHFINKGNNRQGGKNVNDVFNFVIGKMKNSSLYESHLEKVEQLRLELKD